MAKHTLSDLFEGNYGVSQKFGNNPSWNQLGIKPPPGVNGNSPYYGYYGFRGHEGTDFRTPKGTKLLVPFEIGTILRVGWDNAYGNYIVIWDSKQLCAVWYCHLDSVAVLPGRIFSRGTVVGRTGDTGSKGRPHLHVNFVETNSQGGRVNIFNGYKGYLDILNTGLVSWQTGPSLPQTDTEIVKYLRDKVIQGSSDGEFRALARKVLGV